LHAATDLSRFLPCKRILRAVAQQKTNVASLHPGDTAGLVRVGRPLTLPDVPLGSLDMKQTQGRDTQDRRSVVPPMKDHRNP